MLISCPNNAYNLDDLLPSALLQLKFILFETQIQRDLIDGSKKLEVWQDKFELLGNCPKSILGERLARRTHKRRVPARKSVDYCISQPLNHKRRQNNE